MQTLSLAVQNFNNRVKQMNQTNSKQLVLTADEARNLHADIFNLLANMAEIQSKPTETVQETGGLSLDGGSF
jgi:hypothetical protein